MLKFRFVRCSRVGCLYVYQHLINTLFYDNYNLLEDGFSVLSSAEMYDCARCNNNNNNNRISIPPSVVTSEAVLLVAVREKLSLDEDSDILTTSLRISLLCPVCTVYYYSIVAAAGLMAVCVGRNTLFMIPELFSVDLHTLKPSCPVNSLFFDTFGRLAG